MITFGPSVGMLRQVSLSICRSLALFDGKFGLEVSGSGLPLSSCWLPSADTRVTPLPCAYSSALVTASLTVRCCACSAGESAGLSSQLYSHGST